MAAGDPQQAFANEFVNMYYGMFDTNREGLRSFYVSPADWTVFWSLFFEIPESRITFEGDCRIGDTAIMEKYTVSFLSWEVVWEFYSEIDCMSTRKNCTMYTSNPEFLLKRDNSSVNALIAPPPSNKSPSRWKKSIYGSPFS